MFLVLTLIFLCPVLPAAGHMPDPPMKWIAHENSSSCQDSSYIFSFHAHSWHHAVEQCNLYSGHLLSINSLVEQNCVLELARGRNVTRGSKYYGEYWHDGKKVQSVDQ